MEKSLHITFLFVYFLSSIGGENGHFEIDLLYSSFTHFQCTHLNSQMMFMYEIVVIFERKQIFCPQESETISYPIHLSFQNFPCLR